VIQKYTDCVPYTCIRQITISYWAFSGHGRWHPKQRISGSSMKIVTKRISGSSMKIVTAVGQGDPQPILLLWRNYRSRFRASQEQTKSSFTTTRHRATTAEGYGMASGLLFLQIIQQHYQVDWNIMNGHQLICDNKGLLIRIETTLKWTYLHLNVTLRAEWDIELVILKTYREIGWNFQFTHVKSHQDKDIPTASLPLEVQLNVEADRLAAAYLAGSTYQGRASLFPSAKCQFIIDNDTWFFICCISSS
jgi:hypothetical protein